jgi:hypothetical protein
LDLNSNAFRIVRSLTEEKKDIPRTVIARAAGKAGGMARAKSLTPEKRRSIAINANKARWNNGEKPSPTPGGHGI